MFEDNNPSVYVRSLHKKRCLYDLCTVESLYLPKANTSCYG